MNNLSITFHGGAQTVTGSNFLVDTGTDRFLIDCGLLQGEDVEAAENLADFEYNPADIDALIVTHGHLDHVGRIPRLIRKGFRGKIYSTAPTRDIAELILSDSLSIFEYKQKEDPNAEPLFDKNDFTHTFELWETISYHDSVSLNTETSILLKDAGHILGSAMVEISHKGKKILFTGDLGNSPAPLLHNTEPIGDEVEVLVTESVYGNRTHENKEVRTELLRDVVNNTINRGGVLMIPAFSVERTQELLFELNAFVENGEIPRVPVFLDSPLAIEVTEVYKKYNSFFNQNAKDIIHSGDDVFSFPLLSFTENVEESKAINETDGPKIIIAGSGMSTGGRILHHEKRYLSDPNNTLLLIGYQAPGTRGREIADGAKTVEINGDTIPVRARIENIHAYSAHKDADGLLEFVSTGTNLKHVYVVLGEPKAALFFAQRIRDYLGINAVVPTAGQRVEV